LRKKLLAFGLLFLFVCCTLNPVSEGQNVYFKSTKIPSALKNRKIVYVGGTGPDNYSTIQAAINYASDGDTVFVLDDSSPYNENIVVDRPVNIFANNSSKPIIQATGTFAMQINSVNYVNITGFEFRGGSGGVTRIAVRLDSANYCNLTNNIFNRKTKEKAPESK